MSRNDDLYECYLMAHIYSGGNCGDIAPRQAGSRHAPSADVRGNDAKAAVALGQAHGRAGTEALSGKRLVSKVDDMVGWDPNSGGDLSASKVAEALEPGGCKVTVENVAADEAKQPNAGDLADMKAGTQGLGVVTENVVRLLYPWVVGSYNTGDDTTVLNQAIKALHAARDRGEITGRQTIRVSVSTDDPWPTSPTAKSWEVVQGGIPWSPINSRIAIVSASAKWLHTLGEVTEKSLMDDRRIATAVRSEMGKTDADEVINAVRLMAQRDHESLARSIQVMPLNTTIKLRDDIRVALGFVEAPLPEWVKPGAWAFFPNASPTGDYLKVLEVANNNVLFRLPIGRTLLCPSGVVRIAARGICELKSTVQRAKDENVPLEQMVFIIESGLNESRDRTIVEVNSRDIGPSGFPIV